jgi:hypothetical protein
VTALEEIAPAFVEMAHRIVWCSAATVDTRGRPWTRVVHPLWTWDGTALAGIVATDPGSPKRRHLEAHPHVSFTYWTTTHETCSAQCDAELDVSDEGRAAGWAAFAGAPAPVGYDPSMIPRWDSPAAPAFGILRVRPWRLQVLHAPGQQSTWRADR